MHGRSLIQAGQVVYLEHQQLGGGRVFGEWRGSLGRSEGGIIGEGLVVGIWPWRR